MKGARYLTSDEIRRIQNSFRGRYPNRDYALFMTGICTGFRIKELLSVKRGNLVTKAGLIRHELTISRKNMKGKKEGRTIPLNETATNALRPWLKDLEKMGYTHKESAVFQSERGNQALSYSGAYYILQKVFEEAGLFGRLGTHTMRKTFAQHTYNQLKLRQAAGEAVDPIRYVSKLLGHRDIKSTEQYLEIDMDEVLLTVHALTY